MAPDILFSFILISFTSVTACQDHVIIDTSVGPIRGAIDLKKNFVKFLGIPYARVNLTNPFGPSISQPKFLKVFDATRDKDPCPNTDFPANNIASGSLDCLHLNIYIPNDAPEDRLIPVLVFIHGGTHEFGNAISIHYGPQWLVQKGILVVTLQYRVGIYGFLCLDIPEVPANQGLKDQVDALRWIKENILSFGGDPKRITLSGHSSGSQDVHLHFLSNNELVFHQAIFQSGNSLYPFMYKEYNRTIPLILAAKLGVETTDLYEALSFLSTLNPPMLTAVSRIVGIEYGPCIEKPSKDTFIDNYAINVKNMPKFRNTNVMYEQVYKETAHTFCNLPKDEYKKLFKSLLINLFDITGDDLEELVQIVRRYYVRDEFEGDILQSMIDFVSDAWVNYNNKRFINRILESGANKVYFGIFAYTGNRNVLNRPMECDVGWPIYCDDLGYIFEMPVYMRDEVTDDDRDVIERVTTMWVNFVKHGNPTPNITKQLPIKWEPVTIKSPKLNFLEFGQNMTVKTDFYTKRMAFWDVLFDIYETRERNYQEVQLN